MILIIERDDIAQIAQLSALLRANLDQGAKLMQQMDDLKKAQADIAAAIQGAATVMQSAADKLSGVSQQPSIDPADVEAVAQISKSEPRRSTPRRLASRGQSPHSPPPLPLLALRRK